MICIRDHFLPFTKQVYILFIVLISACPVRAAWHSYSDDAFKEYNLSRGSRPDHNWDGDKEKQSRILHCDVGSQDLINAVNKSDQKGVEGLLNNDKQLHKLYQRDKDGNTPFHCAVGKEKIFTLLLKACSRLCKEAHNAKGDLVPVLPCTLTNNQGQTFLDKAVEDINVKHLKKLCSELKTWLRKQKIITNKEEQTPLIESLRLQVFGLFIGGKWDLVDEFFSSQHDDTICSIITFYKNELKKLSDVSKQQPLLHAILNKCKTRSSLYLGVLDTLFDLFHLLATTNKQWNFFTTYLKDKDETFFEKFFRLKQAGIVSFFRKIESKSYDLFFDSDCTLYSLKMARLIGRITQNTDCFSELARQDTIRLGFVFWALWCGNTEFIERLPKEGYRQKYTALMLILADLACKSKQEEDKIFIEEKFDFLLYDASGEGEGTFFEKLSPESLYIFAASGSSCLVSEYLRVHLEPKSLHSLLRVQSDKLENAEHNSLYDKWQTTPLHLALEAKHFLVAAQLASYDIWCGDGWTLTIRDDQGRLPYYWVEEYKNYWSKRIISCDHEANGWIIKKDKKTIKVAALEDFQNVTAYAVLDELIKPKTFGKISFVNKRESKCSICDKIFLLHKWESKCPICSKMLLIEQQQSKKASRQQFRCSGCQEIFYVHNWKSECSKCKAPLSKNESKWPTCDTYRIRYKEEQCNEEMTCKPILDKITGKISRRTSGKLIEFEKKIETTIDIKELVELPLQKEDETYQTRQLLEECVNMWKSKELVDRPYTLLLKGPHGSPFTLIARAIASRLGGEYEEPTKTIGRHDEDTIINFLNGKVVSGKGGFYKIFDSIKAKAKSPNKPYYVFYLGSLEDFAKEPSRNVLQDNSARQACDQLVWELSKLTCNDNVIVIASIPEDIDIDTRLRRHFKQCITLGHPNLHGRQRLIDRLLQMRAPALPFSDDVIKRVSKATDECTRHDLVYFVDKYKLYYPIQNIQKDSVEIARCSLKEMLLYLQKENINGSLKVFDSKSKAITFDKIAGKNETDYQIQKIATNFRNVTGDKRELLPRFIIMYGPPRTGKTLRAQAFANETSYSFMEVSASVFSRPHIGEGAIEVRKIFKQAMENKPTVLFIDELDAVAAKAVHNERINTVNALFKQIDNFIQNDCGVVIAATNRYEEIDNRVTDRANEKIEIPLPDEKSCYKILIFMLKGAEKSYAFPFSKFEKVLAKISGKMYRYGFSVRDIKDTVNTVVRFYAIDERKDITLKDFTDRIKEIAQAKWRKEAGIMFYRFVQVKVAGIKDDMYREQLESGLLAEKQAIKKLVEKREEISGGGHVIRNVCSLDQAKKIVHELFSKGGQITFKQLQGAFEKYRK